MEDLKKINLSDKEHFVYCLILNEKPIYVGCCVNTKRRELSHRQSKIFDYLLIIKKYNNKKQALIAENSIIRFMSILNDVDIINGLNIHLHLEKQLKDEMQSYKKGREVFNGRK